MHLILNSTFTPAVIGAISRFSVNRLEYGRNNDTITGPGAKGGNFDLSNTMTEYIDTVLPLIPLRGYFYQVRLTTWSDIDQ